MVERLDKSMTAAQLGSFVSKEVQVKSTTFGGRVFEIEGKNYSFSQIENVFDEVIKNSSEKDQAHLLVVKDKLVKLYSQGEYTGVMKLLKQISNYIFKSSDLREAKIKEFKQDIQAAKQRKNKLVPKQINRNFIENNKNNSETTEIKNEPALLAKLKTAENLSFLIDSKSEKACQKLIANVKELKEILDHPDTKLEDKKLIKETLFRLDLYTANSFGRPMDPLTDMVSQNQHHLSLNQEILDHKNAIFEMVGSLTYKNEQAANIEDQLQATMNNRANVHSEMWIGILLENYDENSLEYQPQMFNDNVQLEFAAPIEDKVDEQQVAHQLLGQIKNNSNLTFLVADKNERPQLVNNTFLLKELLDAEDTSLEDKKLIKDTLIRLDLYAANTYGGEVVSSITQNLEKYAHHEDINASILDKNFNLNEVVQLAVDNYFVEDTSDNPIERHINYGANLKSLGSLTSILNEVDLSTTEYTPRMITDTVSINIRQVNIEKSEVEKQERVEEDSPYISPEIEVQAKIEEDPPYIMSDWEKSFEAEEELTPMQQLMVQIRSGETVLKTVEKSPPRVVITEAAIKEDGTIGANAYKQSEAFKIAQSQADEIEEAEDEYDPEYSDTPQNFDKLTRATQDFTNDFAKIAENNNEFKNNLERFSTRYQSFEVPSDVEDWTKEIDDEATSLINEFTDLNFEYKRIISDNQPKQEVKVTQKISDNLSTRLDNYGGYIALDNSDLEILKKLRSRG